MNVSEINPFIRVAMPSVLLKGRTLHRRVIYDYELIFVESGTFMLMYNEKEYRVSPGSLLLIRPGVAHSFQLDVENISQPHIHFDLWVRPNSADIPVSFKDIPAMTERELGYIAEDVFTEYSQNPFVKISNFDKFRILFGGIIDVKTSPLEKKGLFVQLLALLIEENFPNILDSREHTLQPIEQQVKNFIDAGQGFSLSLDEFAIQFSYSKYYLEKRFHDAYGVSLIAYRNQKRLETARELLRKHTVSDTAIAVGYPSIFSFSRAYKSRFGVSPMFHRSGLTPPLTNNCETK